MLHATDFCKPITIICGHYGSGKTNLSVNMALDLKRTGHEVTLVDLDIVNPYFRSADFTNILNTAGIRTVNPMFANSNLDIPALTAEITGVFERRDGTAVIDVGGDDAGAAALGRYAQLIQEDQYAFYYVVNQYRYLTRTPAEAVQILHEIEAVSHLKATGILDNSNLAGDTTAQTILDAIPYAREVSELAGLPLIAHVFERSLADVLKDSGLDGYPVDVFVKPPWENPTALPQL